MKRNETRNELNFVNRWRCILERIDWVVVFECMNEFDASGFFLLRAYNIERFNRLLLIQCLGEQNASLETQRRTLR